LLCGRDKINEKQKKYNPTKTIRQKKLPLDLIITQKLRRVARKNSLIIWQNNSSAVEFDTSMRRTLSLLRYMSKINRYRKMFRKRFTKETK